MNDLRAPSTATIAFLARLGCTESFDSQAAASAKIEQLLKDRDTAKAASDKQHSALAALGGRPLPGAIHREISRVIAVLTALEAIDMTAGPGYSNDQYSEAHEKLAEVCREMFQKQPSARVRANAQTPTEAAAPEAPAPAVSGAADIPF